MAGDPKDANVLEIGCGDGRDAKDIVTRTPNYTGFDISKELIKLARALVPSAHFEVADATGYSYLPGLDIVFAFASLLHLDKHELRETFKKVYTALRPGGIFYISLKSAPQYQEFVKEDKYGRRLFYLYNPELVEDLAGSEYERVYINQKIHGSTAWLEMAFRKKA